MFNKINEKREFIELFLNYKVVNQSKFLLIFFFMAFVWFLSIIEAFSFRLLGFPYVMIVTGLIVYLNLLREGYEIPYNKLVISLFFFSFSCLLVKTMKLLT